MPWKYFDEWEFASPDAPGSGSRMHRPLVDKLDIMREECGFPFVITSGFRTTQHNSAVGGVADSEHCFGMAVDISVRDSNSRFRLVQAAIRHGFTRIGIARTFIHLGISDTHPQNVIWMYGDD